MSGLKQGPLWDAIDMKTAITSLGNAGVQVTHGGHTFLIDAFYRGFVGVAASPWEGVKRIAKADAILVTHDHWDHFNPDAVAEASQRMGAVVIGPAPVISKLKGCLPVSSLLELEPAGRDRTGRYTGLRVETAGLVVTAFRTLHSKAHNSYLVELPGLRVFHDGDNEHTEHFDVSALVNLDALMLCPWRGSGWADFIGKIRPRNWFLIHMTAAELDEHESGTFFADLCEKEPMASIALRPGDRYELSASGASCAND